MADYKIKYGKAFLQWIQEMSELSECCDPYTPIRAGTSGAFAALPVSLRAEGEAKAKKSRQCVIARSEATKQSRHCFL
ncbi:MAG: hypothetical protein ACP5TY_03240 [Thermodesulforhabdaceae bacterium]|jgi:hypothetical protein